MKNLLRSKEYWGVVSGGYKESGPGEMFTLEHNKILDERKLKDLTANNYLFSSIDKTLLKTITQKATTKKLWDSMKTRYQ
ncbi:hypothetical protein LINPERPRIM_LOCUS7875 [Linum perenne]